MLWLTGLFGLAVVGAVSFLDLSGKDTDDESEDLGFDDFLDENGFGDLTPTLESLNALPSDGAGDGEQSLDLETYEKLVALRDAETAGAEQNEPANEAQTWFAQSDPADFADFDPATEELVLVWDDGLDPEPDVDMAASEDDPTRIDLRIDDEVVAQFSEADGVTPDLVSLMPFSTAQSLGLI